MHSNRAYWPKDERKKGIELLFSLFKYYHCLLVNRFLFVCIWIMAHWRREEKEKKKIQTLMCRLKSYVSVNSFYFCVVCNRQTVKTNKIKLEAK